MNIANLKVIVFDLDNTLFDHSRAERIALTILIREFSEIFKSVSNEKILKTYHINNTQLWKKFGKGEITSQLLKILRFKITLEEINCSSDNAEELSKRYFEIYSKQACIIPNAEEILKYLKPKYQLGILSNGFTTTLEGKLKNIQLNSYFSFKIYSGKIGALKPNPIIFREAMRIAEVEPHEVVCIGDSYEDDVQGAKAVGWNVIHYIPNGVFLNYSIADYEIRDLLELKQIL